MTINLSDEYRLDLTLNAVIFEAYDLLQVAADGETIVGGLFNRARDSVNMMLKLWESQGIHLWTMTEGSLFLRVRREKNDFRLEGSDTTAVHLTNVFRQKTLAVAMTATDLTATLEDVDDMQIGDQIGIINDGTATDAVANDLEWFIVMDITGDVVTFDHAALTNAILGTVVYTYDYLNFSLLTADTVADAIVEVADTTLFNVGDSINVLLDTNVTEERIIAAINQATNELTVTVAFTGTASTGQACVNLTTRRNKFIPVKRILNDNVRRRESTNYEIPIVFQSRKDYFDLPNKNQPGTPIQAYYDRQIPQGVMYLWNSPSSAVSIINFTYERKIQVMTEATQTFDVPEDWYDAITYNLAKRLIPKVGCSQERKVDIVTGAQEYLDAALGFDQAVYPIRLKPQRYG
jgi:hypothetical protein